MKAKHRQLLKAVNKALTLLVYLVYPSLLMALAFGNDSRLWRVLVTPGISFVLVSVFRKYFNAPRPYEVLNITPLIAKDTKGKSFPSRHVFSVFVIAMAFHYILPWAGILLMGIGVLLAAIRVVGGVHFPKDVIAGAIIGILSGLMGFYIIP